MLIKVYVNKKHLIFLIYFFIELIKRISKDQYTNIDKNANNLLIFISHFFSFIFYLIEKKNSKKKKNVNEIKFNYNNNDLFKIIILIFFCSILDLINFYPMHNFPLLKGIKLVIDNTQEFYMFVCIILEKMFLKIKYYKHHYLSFNIFLIYLIYNLIVLKNSQKYEISKLFIYSIYYCFFHYYPMAFVYIIYYHINNCYYISIFLISFIKGILCIIGTICIEYFINYPKQNYFFINTSNYDYYHYFYMFLTLICMTIQNYLCILMILFFKPTFFGITLIYVPTIKFLHNLIKKNFSKKPLDNLNILIFQLILFFSISIYLEIITLGFFNLDYNVKENILNRCIDLNFEKLGQNLPNNSLDNSCIQ